MQMETVSALGEHDPGKPLPAGTPQSPVKQLHEQLEHNLACAMMEMPIRS